MRFSWYWRTREENDHADASAAGTLVAIPGAGGGARGGAGVSSRGDRAGPDRAWVFARESAGRRATRDGTRDADAGRVTRGLAVAGRRGSMAGCQGHVAGPAKEPGVHHRRDAYVCTGCRSERGDVLAHRPVDVSSAAAD